MTRRPDDHDPTLLDVRAAQAQAREQSAAAETIVAEFPKQMRRIARDAGARQGRLWGIITLALALLISFLAGGLAVNTKLATSADISAIRVAEQQRQQQVDNALDKLNQANKVLESRGQPPIPTPPAGDPNDAITAAVTARVIAQLPPAPTAQQVADAIAPAVTASVVGPSQAELAGLVAAYYQAHPPQPGPPPSEAAIRAAVDASLAANPPASGAPGPPGPKGDPCSPSDPACVGPQGPAGPAGPMGAAGAAGRGIASGPAPVRTDDGSCVWHTTYTDGTSEDDPASPVACPLGK